MRRGHSTAPDLISCSNPTMRVSFRRTEISNSRLVGSSQPNAGTLQLGIPDFVGGLARLEGVDAALCKAAHALFPMQSVAGGASAASGCNRTKRRCAA